MHEILARANFDRDVKALKEVDGAARRGLKLNDLDFPTIDVNICHTQDLRLRLTCDDWDDLPPAIELLQPDGTPWIAALPGGVFNSGPHRFTKKCFICMRGSREYHTHENHTNDKWENYRGQDGMDIVGIVAQLGRAWRKAIK